MRLGVKQTTLEFQPDRTDYIIRWFARKSTRNPLALAFNYSVASVGGALLLAALMDAFRGTNLVFRMSRDYANLINMGIVLPLGILLVLRFYKALQVGFTQLIRDKVLQFSDQESAKAYINSVEAALNRAWFFPVALLASVLINLLIFYGKEGMWNGWGAGPQAWWFRFFIVINFYMIINVLLRGFATVQQIRCVFDGSYGKRIVLQPLHPDGCGGLKRLGAISVALNSFLCLLAVYFSVLAFAKSAEQTAQPSDYPFFIPMVIGFVLLSIYLFLAPLSRAHDVMEQEKTKILSALNAEFQKSYRVITSQIEAEGIHLEDAQKIESIERLYRIANKMPVWPMDAGILRQLGITITVPLLLGLVTELINRQVLGN
jgi:hypothetical protein